MAAVSHCGGTLGTLVIAFALTFAGMGARAEGDAANAEYRIKAAFLVKFLDFIEWPPAALERADTPLVIGVLGAKPLRDQLGQFVAGRQVNGHPVQVRTLGPGESAAGLQVLFLGSTELARLPAIAATSDGQALLVVTESESAPLPASTINFVVVDDKVRFDVSLRMADKAGLKISARLLAVARTVWPNPP